MRRCAQLLVVARVRVRAGVWGLELFERQVWTLEGGHLCK